MEKVITLGIEKNGNYMRVGINVPSGDNIIAVVNSNPNDPSAVLEESISSSKPYEFQIAALAGGILRICTADKTPIAVFSYCSGYDYVMISYIDADNATQNVMRCDLGSVINDHSELIKARYVSYANESIEMTFPSIDRSKQAIQGRLISSSGAYDGVFGRTINVDTSIDSLSMVLTYTDLPESDVTITMNYTDTTEPEISN